MALGSAIVTGDMERPAEYFGVSEEVIILASVTVFVIGFGVGPLVFAPCQKKLVESLFMWSPYLLQWYLSFLVVPLKHRHINCLSFDRWYCIQCTNDIDWWVVSRYLGRS